MSDLTPERERMLEECLGLLDGGASLEDCLSRYPEAADELRPFLELRVSLTAAGQLEPPAGAYEDGHSRLLAQLETQQSSRTSTTFWSGLTRFFVGEQRWSGALARTAAVMTAVFVVGVGALGASAAGGFEPARDALEPARDVLATLGIISGDDESNREGPDERPRDSESDVPADPEVTREPERDEPAPTECPRLSDRRCVDQARLTPTLERDIRVTETPLRDARPTATPVRDAPLRPIDRVATVERPIDIAPVDAPEDEATATSIRDAEQFDRPVDDALNDTRGGEQEATVELPKGDLPDEEPLATRTPEPPAADEPGQDAADVVERSDGGSDDGGRTGPR